MKINLDSIKNRLKSYLLEVVKKINFTHRLDYARFPIYLHDNIRLASCKKEPETVKWIETFQKDDTVFDIGANVGVYSLIMAKYANKIYAFEPSTFTFSVLNKNILANKAENIISLNIALSNKRQINVFTYSSTELGSSSHVFGQANTQGVFRQQILSYSIDNFLEDFTIRQVNHIKIDVDGNEFEILKGAQKTLEQPWLKSLLVEISDPDNKPLFDFLKQRGLVLKEKYPAGIPVYNYLYVRT